MRLPHPGLICLYLCTRTVTGGQQEDVEAKGEDEEAVATDNTVENEKPNIIFIMVDDVGWTDFNYNTPEFSSIPTPNIDSLAQQGFD